VANEVDLEGMQRLHAPKRAEREELHEKLSACRKELHSLRTRLASCEEEGRELASKLHNLKHESKEAVAKLKAEQMEELAELRAQQTEELAVLEAQQQTQMATLRAQRSEEASRLRCSVKDALQRRERQRFERDEVCEQLVSRQQEGQQLQQQLTEARQAVFDLSTQLKGVHVHPHVASQLGLSLDASDASMSFQFQLPHDPRLEGELMSTRDLCKSLERECARTHDLLEKKQAECERWRKRVVDTQGLLLLQKDHHEGEKLSAPITLGPTFEAAEESDA